jgi:glycosyltransferase involved in cell wall biosynthesis
VSATQRSVPQQAGWRREKIVHVIDSLARGGTETFLINLLPDLLERYEIILVCLGAETDFPESQLLGVERHVLGFTGSSSIPMAVLRLRRIIARHQPALVRAQLFMSGIVARLATPHDTPLVFSLHSRMSDDCYRKNRLAAPVERLTYNQRHYVVAVTRDALNDFDQWIGIKGPSDVLPNFINPAFLEAARIRTHLGPEIRLVAAGMLKAVKNYFFLVEAFRLLADVPRLSLDIYGEGSLRGALQRDIDSHGLPIRLLGKRPDIHAVLPDYDLFVMPSLYEGFANAAVEAMAAGLPVMLSDLPALREVTHGNAVFFDPTDPTSFAQELRGILRGAVPLQSLSERGIQIVRDHYGRGEYLRRLEVMYAAALQMRASL